MMYLAIDFYCLVKHQHRTEAPDITDRVSQLFSFNSISVKMFLFSICDFCLLYEPFIILFMFGIS